MLLLLLLLPANIWRDIKIRSPPFFIRLVDVITNCGLWRQLKSQLESCKLYLQLFTRYIPAVTRWTLKFSPGNDFDHLSPGNNRKTALWWNLTMTGDTELMTWVPRWYIFYRGFPCQVIFLHRGFHLCGALSWDIAGGMSRLNSYLLTISPSPNQANSFCTNWPEICQMSRMELQ